MSMGDKLLLALVGYVVITGLIWGVLAFITHAKKLSLCPHCGGKTKPWSTKFAICTVCKRRDDEPSI